MRLHIIQHVGFEGPGYIRSWAVDRGHGVSETLFFDGQSLPPSDDVDALVVLGGPMSVFDETQYPWLADEKRYIKEAVDTGKQVLGICLGAQLLAHVLGSVVKPAPNKEIGWFPVSPTEDAKSLPWFHGVFAEHPTVFHWHADKFEIPFGAIDLATTDANKNQAFAVGDRLLALQFHVETTPQGVSALVEHAKADIVPGHFVQDEQALLAGSTNAGNPALCYRVLDGFFH